MAKHTCKVHQIELQYVPGMDSYLCWKCEQEDFEPSYTPQKTEDPDQRLSRLELEDDALQQQFTEQQLAESHREPA